MNSVGAASETCVDPVTTEITRSAYSAIISEAKARAEYGFEPSA